MEISSYKSKYELYNELIINKQIGRWPRLCTTDQYRSQAYIRTKIIYKEYYITQIAI